METKVPYYDLFGGRPPHASKDTSLEAAKRIVPHLTALASQVWETIKGESFLGATCDEIEKKLDLSHQTVSARIRELCLKKKIIDSGVRRTTRSGRRAIVWKAV